MQLKKNCSVLFFLFFIGFRINFFIYKTFLTTSFSDMAGSALRSKENSLPLYPQKKSTNFCPYMRLKIFFLAGNSESDLRSALQSLIFKNEPGVVEKKQNFAYISQCGLYTEPQNVSQVRVKLLIDPSFL